MKTMDFAPHRWDRRKRGHPRPHVGLSVLFRRAHFFDFADCDFESKTRHSPGISSKFGLKTPVVIRLFKWPPCFFHP